MIFATSLVDVTDCLIGIAAGVFMTLYGFRFFSAKPRVNPQVDEWHRKFGFYFRFGGVVVAIGGIAKLILRLSRD